MSSLVVPRREFVVLKAYLEHGSHKAAAHSLGIATGTSRQRMSQLQRRLGARTAAECAFILRHDLEREGVRSFAPHHRVSVDTMDSRPEEAE